MVIWRGWGILAGIIPLGLLILLELGFESAVGSDAFYQRNSDWLGLLGLLAAAPVVWFLGRRLNRSGIPHIDVESGRETYARPNHTMFFVRMENWAFILPVLWVAILLL